MRNNKDSEREKTESHYRRTIIKVGSSIIIDEEKNTYRKQWLESVAKDISELRNEVVIVTSGAVGLGRKSLGFGNGKLKLEEKQACAAAGQILLAGAYREAFLKHEINVAQVLLTPEDTENRRRYLNARSTLTTLLANKVIPIINENDTTATEELRFGDNDRLAARVAQMISADLLIILSDVDGLYNTNPLKDKNAKLIEKVEAITSEIERMAGGTGSDVGTGGMASKIAAAKIATSSGVRVIITKGKENHPISKLAAGGVHTEFLATKDANNARKQWIAGSLKPQGELVLDDGAITALKSGKSLLPAGVKRVSGSFERGDAVRLISADSKEIGVGISAYSSTDALKIIGKKTSEIESILGYSGRDELIHRDDLAIT